MKKNIIIRIFAILLALVTLCALCACGDENTSSVTDDTMTKLSFKSALSYDYLKTLNGKQVSINGYLATSSPSDGSFIFLMNMPFQSCPFCVPNTSQLSNTMEVYPKKGKTFSYTNQAVKVVGTLVVANEGSNFTDPYGYEFNFKLIDADYSILSSDDMTSEIALWQKISSTDVFTQLNNMFEYVNFTCAWNTYQVNSYTDMDGNLVKGYMLYPSDANNYLTKDGAQFNYGYKEGYFDNIIKAVRKVDATAFEDLVKIIEKAKELSAKGLAELEAGNYTWEEKYLEQFDNTDYVYTLNIGEQLQNEMTELYSSYQNWMAGWEM